MFGLHILREWSLGSDVLVLKRMWESLNCYRTLAGKSCWMLSLAFLTEDKQVLGHSRNGMLAEGTLAQLLSAFPTMQCEA